MDDKETIKKSIEAVLGHVGRFFQNAGLKIDLDDLQHDQFTLTLTNDGVVEGVVHVMQMNRGAFSVAMGHIFGKAPFGVSYRAQLLERLLEKGYAVAEDGLALEGSLLMQHPSITDAAA